VPVWACPATSRRERHGQGLDWIGVPWVKPASWMPASSEASNPRVSNRVEVEQVTHCLLRVMELRMGLENGVGKR